MSRRRFGRMARSVRIAAASIRAFARCKANRPALACTSAIECRKPFTVRIGTIFESSPYPAASVVAGDPSGLLVQERHQREPIPSHPLGFTLKTAWFLAHRIREAMRDGSICRPWAATVEPLRLTKPCSAALRALPRKLVKGGRSVSATSPSLLWSAAARPARFHIEGATIADMKPIIQRQRRARSADRD